MSNAPTAFDAVTCHMSPLTCYNPPCMLLSDYVIQFLVKHKITDIFLVSGGGIMYLTDSVGRNKKMTYYSCHHEQACATAAEAWARVKNIPGACLVTTGPGGTNAITGVAAAWVDSIPMIVISGQVKRETIADYKKMRAFGPQEINIVDMVAPITKYAVTVMNPQDIRYHMEKAYHLATTGRPGPVWIDIPLDVQGAKINAKNLKNFSPPKTQEHVISPKILKKTISMLEKSTRPVIIAGNGIRLSNSLNAFYKLIRKIKIPILLPINGLDLIPHDYQYFSAKFGPGGQRSGNLVLQNSDLILSIGASLNPASTGFNFEKFAPNAKKIMVNIDSSELNKKNYKPHLKIKSDAKIFITEFLNETNKARLNNYDSWINTCNMWKKKYPVIISDFGKDKKYVNSYVFVDTLSNYLKENETVTTGMGLDAHSVFQALKIKNGQRAFLNKNFGQMGWCLPAAIGANIAGGKKRSICITGDGCIQFNIQELGTISYYLLPIKIFIFSNEGYESIRSTQSNLFKRRFVGADKDSGVSNPNFKKIADSYKIKYLEIKSNSKIKTIIHKVLRTNGPVICEIHINPKQKRVPKMVSYRREDGKLESRPLEDMAPLLPRQELWEIMNKFKKK